MTVRQTPQPSRSFARKVVRKAGPQEKAFFTNSTLVEIGLFPSTYSSAAIRTSENNFPVFTPSDYGTQIGSRERILIRKLDVVVHTWTLEGSSELPVHVSGLGCLLVGTDDDISQNVTGPNQFPFATQGSVIGFADVNPKVVKYKARKVINRLIPGTQYTDPGTDANTTALVQARCPYYQRWKFTIRNLWMKEPEQVNLFLFTIKTPMAVGDTADLFGGIVGWHETYCAYSKY